MFSGASHPDVSDAGGDHLHTGGQYALDSQAEQDQYEGELQCLADRVETPEEKKRLSEAMELSNIREHLKSQDVYAAFEKWKVPSETDPLYVFKLTDRYTAFNAFRC